MINNYAKTLGASGTQIYSGIITAEEYNANLKGHQLLKNIDIMRRSDSTIKMIIKLVTRPLMGLVWDIEPATDENGKSTPEDIKRAQNTKKDLFHNPYFTWDNFQQQAFTYLPFGFAVFELTSKPRDINGQKLFGTHEIGFRKQTSIEAWETDDKRPGVKQLLMGTQTKTGAPNYAYIPMEKLVVFTHEKEGDNYEGISMLRAAYKDFDIKDKLSLILAVGLEKQAIPVPIVTLPQTKGLSNIDNDADVQKMIEILKNIRANHEQYIIKLSGWDIEKLDMSGQTTKEILPAIKYFDHQMQMLVLAPFMGLGSEGASGSRAVGDVQYKPYLYELESIATEFQQTIQTQWINRLCDMNYTDMPNGYPKLVHSKIQDDDLTSLGEYLSKLSSASLLTANFDTEQHLRRLAHLPELTDEDKTRYEEKQQQADELAKKALENPNDPNDNNEDGTSKRAKNDTKSTPSNEDKKAKADAALQRLRLANREANRANRFAMDVFPSHQGR